MSHTQKKQHLDLLSNKKYTWVCYITLIHFVYSKVILWRQMDFYSVTTQDILDRISRHCPEALSVYLSCINRASKEGTVFFSRQMIDVDMSEEWHKFRGNIKKLARENLLEWHPIDNGISVTLAALDEEE